MNEETNLDKIYKRFGIIRNEAKQDCNFQMSHIETSYDNTIKIMKWIDKKVEYNKLLRDYESKQKEIYKNLYMHYKTESDLILTKEEYQLFIESDPAYYNIYQETLLIKEIVQYIGDVVTTLQSRAWEIKGYLEYLKFASGK